METGRRLGALDGWRGASIALVLLGHFFPIGIINLGTWGVEWFFVLSGRLMAEILFVRSAPLPEFYRRRLSRIYPVLALYVVLTFILSLKTPAHYKPTAALLALTFTINYGTIFVGHLVPLLAHIWSLCIEEHTYLILGCIAWLSRRGGLKPFPVLVVLAALSVADATISSNLPHRNFFDVSWRTDSHIYSILFGALAHMVAIKLDRGAERRLRWLAPVALVFALAFQIGAVLLSQFVGTVLSTAALAVAVCSLDRTFPSLERVFNFVWLRRLGVMSFSIYLWQQPAFRLSIPLPPLSRGALLAAAVAVGVASFYFVEQPARKFLNGLSLGGSRVVRRRASPASP